MTVSQYSFRENCGVQRRLAPAALAVAGLFVFVVAGCHGPSRTSVVQPVSSTASLAARGYGAQPVNTNRVAALAKQCGGDWNKLGPGGKKYMLEDVTDGDVNAAKAMLANAASHS